MNICQQDEKDISKLFAFLRIQLQNKEKELLELQRKDPYLLAPDSDQIDILIDTIASVQLSTEEGSFVFSSTSDYDDFSPLISACSIDFNSIKTLPSTVWLSQTHSTKQQNEQRTSFFSHLLSLPIKNYLASSFITNTKTSNQFSNRIPLANHLLFMPINAFKPSTNTCTSSEIKHKKELENDMLSIPTNTIKSVLNSESIYSKEYWLQNK
ncbi:unnamed protein product [Adineta steineri]|uniref:Uncharacterized protein n=1 Tax=Adineta steineri TaxID=433720 RepID=A0A814U7W5_9BILA|nr:unnamed protein product [Adineta steineri]